MKHELNHPAVASATILIVDDMAENLSVLGNILQDAGYTVKAATSGTQALRYAGELC
jgi:CheY-like chemotaxis protein